MPNNSRSDGVRTLHLQPVLPEQLSEILSMDKDTFCERAEKMGWQPEYNPDDTFIDKIYDTIQKLKESNPGVLTNDHFLVKTAANILYRDLSKSPYKASHKLDLVNYATSPRTSEQSLGLLFNYKYEGKQNMLNAFEEDVKDEAAANNNSYRDSLDEVDITNFDYSYNPVLATKSWENNKLDFLAESKAFWNTMDDQNVLNTLYDACVGDDGILDEELAKQMRNLPTKTGGMTEAQIISAKKDAIQQVHNTFATKFHRLSERQKSAYYVAGTYLNEFIPKQEKEAYLRTPEGKKKTWLDNAFDNHAYVHGAYGTLSAIYNATLNAPEGSELWKLKDAFANMRPVGYDEKSMADQPALVTSMLLEDAKKVLGTAEKTEAVQRALKEIEEFEPKLAKARDEELKELPFARAYKFVTNADLEQVGSLAESMRGTENKDGAGPTDEFKEMLESMTKFSKETAGYGKGTAYGVWLMRAMKNLNDSIEKFVASEKKAKGEEYVQNPNVGLAVGALNKVNPFRAAEHRSEIAVRLYENLSNTKKEWYDWKNTDEYKDFLNALKAFKDKKPGDEGYEKAADDLKTYAMSYISKKKGGLNVDAHQTGGDARRKMAILSVALVDLTAAQQMVDEANKVRTAKGLKEIDLKELALKEGFGELVKDKIDHSKATVKAEPKKVKEAPELGGPKLPGMK